MFHACALFFYSLALGLGPTRHESTYCGCRRSPCNKFSKASGLDSSQMATIQKQLLN